MTAASICVESFFLLGYKGANSGTKKHLVFIAIAGRLQVRSRGKRMKQMNIREARRSLSHLERLLAAEGKVTIVRRGKAVAGVIPVAKTLAILSHRWSKPSSW